MIKVTSLQIFGTLWINLRIWESADKIVKGNCPSDTNIDEISSYVNAIVSWTEECEIKLNNCNDVEF
ncbi:unnamed protein product [Dicrocoelium dendriticum]|nr:unnamed protein product [Dicrocoelium dendriticum]